MAKVNVVNKQVRMELTAIVRYQLITHCYINHIVLSELDYDCLTTLGLIGESELTDFCTYMAEKRLEEKMKNWNPSVRGSKPSASPQTIRNVLIKVEKDGLIEKTGKSRKKISINPELKIQSAGNILLNHKIVCIESQEA